MCTFPFSFHLAYFRNHAMKHCIVFFFKGFIYIVNYVIVIVVSFVYSCFVRHFMNIFSLGAIICNIK